MNRDELLQADKLDLAGYKLWEKQFDRYLRANDDRSLDVKALSVGSNPDGGYLVPTARSARIIQKIFETSPLRSLASIETIGTSELELPIDTDEAAVGWVGEQQARATTNTPQVGVQKIPVHELYAKPRATQKFLEDASINVEAWLADKIADKMSRTEATAFIIGNGINQPRGILSYTPTTAPGSVARGTPLTYNSGGATIVTADAIVALPFMLKSAYLPGSSWLMKRSSVMAVMLLKDGQGQYLWRPGLSVGGVSTLGGYDVNMADDMPAIGAGVYAMAFGNWRRAYTIVDRLGITTLRDPYSAKPFVEFYSRKRVGGDVTDFDAYVTMTIAA
jgi:HK97 family phage major capsid protein